MPRKKYTYDINDVELTHVQSGDQDNNVYYSYFSGNNDAKAKVLSALLTPHTANDIIDIIFKGDITDDQLRKIITALTFMDAICKITNTTIAVTSSDLFFATLVNWNASRGNGTNRIRSYTALRFAKESAKLSEDNNLDYREYIVNGDSAGKFNNEYISIVISPKEFGNKLELNLPIIRMKLGLFRFATEHIAAYMHIVGDNDKTSHTIPSYIWLDMIAAAMSRRITTKFSKLENNHLYKLVDPDARYINEILAINDFRSAASFPNIYDFECDENDGTLTINKTQEPPEINATGFEWTETRENSWFLKSHRFYIVSTHGSAVHILTQN